MLILAALLAVLPPSPAPLLPLPREVRWGEGRLRLDSTATATTSGFHDRRLGRGIARTLAHLEQRIALPLADSAGGGAGGTLVVAVLGAGQPVQGPGEDESYTLDVTPAGARLTAPTVVGALRGLATLEQLVQADSAGFYLPAVHISDAPRFPWRGVLIDAGRHFVPPELIRRTLDGMAAVKLNVLHWHLSEDQGFRVESKRFPKLHELGSDGQYYTQQELRDLVAYARDRGIRVVPEFDMPGHATSWFVGYPEHASAPGPYAIERRFGVFPPAFDPTRESTYLFLEQFITEMAGIFPDPYWHIGGDEVMGKQWNENPRIAAYKRTHGMRTNEALQAYFNQRLSRILARHHRRMVGWDEILHEGIPAGTVVQSWRGTEYLGRAARQGLDGILSAPWYLDHIKTAEDHYLADPLPAGSTLTPEEARHVLGGEACMWAEHVNPETLESRLWPRLGAIAERLWSPADVRDVADLYRRLSPLSLQLERLGLTHEAHVGRMLRRLTNQRESPVLERLLRYAMPVSFGERSSLQRTTQLTPLTRLVDAARPDPWARVALRERATELVASEFRDQAALHDLRATFSQWMALPGEVEALLPTTPLAADGLPAARALAELGRLAQDVIDWRTGAVVAPDGWQASTHARLDELNKPQGLLRLAGIDAVRALVGPRSPSP